MAIDNNDRHNSGQSFDVNDAVMLAFKLPGGINLLIRIVSWSAALFLLVYFVLGRGVISVYFNMMQQLLVLDSSGSNDPQAVLTAVEPMMAMMGGVLLLSLCSWGIMISAETAMHKNIFHKIDEGIFPLRFGSAELRVMLAQLIVYLICMGVYFVGYLILILMIVLATTIGKGSALGVIFGILAFISFFAIFAFLIYIMVRLAPTAAMSVRDSEIKTVEGRHASRGRFWPMFGSYVIIGFAGYMVLAVVIGLGLTISFSNIDFAALMAGGQPEDITKLFKAIGQAAQTPRSMIPLVITLMLYTFMMMLWYLCYFGVASYAAQTEK